MYKILLSTASVLLIQCGVLLVTVQGVLEWFRKFNPMHSWILTQLSYQLGNIEDFYDWSECCRKIFKNDSNKQCLLELFPH
jgi:hypothetical protein